MTIPVLPERLAQVMTNAYLLCRLADTIEDDVGLDAAQKSAFHERFVAVVKGEEPAKIVLRKGCDRAPQCRHRREHGKRQ